MGYPYPMHLLFLFEALTRAAPMPTLPEPPPALALHLDSVTLSAQMVSPPSALVSCRARWVNHTGATLPAITSFGGVFDGLSLVGFSREGREILRLPYLFHQSPYAESRHIELSVGETAGTLVFPLDGVQLGDISCYRLEGSLTGNDAAGTFSTTCRPLEVFR